MSPDSKYALGALGVLQAEKAKNPEEAEKLLRKAIEVSIRWDAYSGGDITIMSQKGTKS